MVTILSKVSLSPLESSGRVGAESFCVPCKRRLCCSPSRRQSAGLMRQRFGEDVWNEVFCLRATFCHSATTSDKCVFVCVWSSVSSLNLPPMHASMYPPYCVFMDVCVISPCSHVDCFRTSATFRPAWKDDVISRGRRQILPGELCVTFVCVCV